MESCDECGRVVHRPCSSCISSVQNQMGTLSSSPCQLRLGVWLSHLRLSCYTPSPTNVITIPHITVKGEINQRIIHYLLDCSATANFISKSFSKKLNLIPISKLNEPVRGLGSKILFNAPLYIYHLWYTLQGIPSENMFIGALTGKYQVVLGLPWFCQVNPRINWVDLWVQFQEQSEHLLDI